MWPAKAFRTETRDKNTRKVPGVNQRKGHRKWPLMELCVCHLKYVEVEDLMGSDVPTI